MKGKRELGEVKEFGDHQGRTEKKKERKKNPSSNS